MATKQQGSQNAGHSLGEKGGIGRRGAGSTSRKKLQGRTKSISSRSASDASKVKNDSRTTRSAATVARQSQSTTKRASKKTIRKTSSGSPVAPKRSLGARIRDVAKTLVAKVRPVKPREASGTPETSPAGAISTIRQSKPALRRVTPVAPSVHRDDEFSPSQRSANRADRPRDHESDLMILMADERFNEEDRYTNRSGDPRIGTHGRTYEREEERK